MQIHIGEIHAEVSATTPLTTPESRPQADAEQRSRDAMLDGLRRLAWLTNRVAADGFDD